MGFSEVFLKGFFWKVFFLKRGFERSLFEFCSFRGGFFFKKGGFFIGFF